MSIAIAIDGPSGAGKSTLAKRLAGEMGYLYVDTGAMFRAVGLYALRAGKDPADAAAVEALLPAVTLTLAHVDGAQHIYLNGEDVSEAIRQEQVGMAASAVAVHPAVRSFLLGQQRAIASTNNVLMDGRDIGTVVLPDAELKIFLTATPEDRARRRYEELVEKGEAVTFDEVLKDVIQRDYNDTHRDIAPLRQAEDAVLADTTGFELPQSVALIRSLVEKKLGKETAR